MFVKKPKPRNYDKPIYIYNGETQKELEKILCEKNPLTKQYLEKKNEKTEEIGYILLTDKKSYDEYMWHFLNFWFCGWRAIIEKRRNDDE